MACHWPRRCSLSFYNPINLLLIHTAHSQLDNLISNTIDTLSVTVCFVFCVSGALKGEVMASNNSSSEGGHVGSSEQWDRERARCRRLVVARQPRSWMKSH